jgi:hypothetical protein
MRTPPPRAWQFGVQLWLILLAILLARAKSQSQT